MAEKENDYFIFINQLLFEKNMAALWIASLSPTNDSNFYALEVGS
jgi:hypothetical protein